MNNKNSATVLIAYHANCIDGFTAAWVTAVAMNREDKQYKLLPMEYNQESTDKLYAELCDPDLVTLYIVDFSVSIECLQILATMGGLTTVLLDHHKTAFERYCPDMEVTPTSRVSKHIHNTAVMLDNNHSGAAIAWNYFNTGTETPALIRYVEDYDLWRFNFGNETKLINKFLKDQLQMDGTIDNWSNIAERMEDLDILGLILEQGRLLQRVHDEHVRQIAAEADGIVICGESGLAVACPYEFVSDVGHALAKKCGTFGAMYQVDVTANKVKWSLRSEADFDVSEIATYYSGGGHKNAAGFETQLFSETPAIETMDELVDLAEEMYGE